MLYKLNFLLLMCNFLLHMLYKNLLLLNYNIQLSMLLCLKHLDNNIRLYMLNKYLLLRHYIFLLHKVNSLRLLLNYNILLSSLYMCYLIDMFQHHIVSILHSLLLFHHLLLLNLIPLVGLSNLFHLNLPNLHICDLPL